MATFVLRQGTAASRAKTGANQPGFSPPAAGGPLGAWPLRCQSDPKVGKDMRFREMLRATRNVEFAASEELHVSHVPVHHKYPQTIALGIRGKYKKPFAVGIVSLRRAYDLFPVGEGHLNFPP